MNTARRPSRCAAFTVTELLVVIGVFAFLLGVGLPAVNAIQSYGAQANGRGQVANAVAAARAYATRQKVFAEHGEYSGAAALFTPAGQIRLVENVPDLEDSTGDKLEADGRSGYNDIPGTEVARLPHNIRVAAIARSDDGPILLAAPFAVRFSEHGILTVGRSQSHRVYYDSDGEDGVDTGADRGDGYNPGVYDPDSRDFDADEAYAFASGERDRRLVFSIEVVETVIGLHVFDRDDLRDAGHNLIATGDDRHPIAAAAADWIRKNAIETLLFDRYTGQPVKERSP